MMSNNEVLAVLDSTDGSYSTELWEQQRFAGQLLRRPFSLVYVRTKGDTKDIRYMLWNGRVWEADNNRAEVMDEELLFAIFHAAAAFKRGQL